MLTEPNADENVENQELPFNAGGNAKMTRPLWKAVWQFRSKLTIHLTCALAMGLLSIYQMI